MRSKRLTGSFLAAILLAAFTCLGGPAAAEPPAHESERSALPLGPAGLVETRTARVLQPGVTLTTIVRGHADPADDWTVELNIPAGSTSPDPDAPPAALSDRTDAEALANRVRTAGFSPRAEEVTAPATADYAPGTLGWRVRVGHFATQAESDAELARLVAAGFAGASRFTGWDGSPTDRGPWRLQVITIDPRSFTGQAERAFAACQKRGVTLALGIITNGLLLTEELVDRLLPYGLDYVKVTLDGDRDTHNRMRPLRGGQGTFDRIIENVRKVAGKVRIAVGGNFDADSVESYPALLDFLKEQDFADKLAKVAFKPVVRERQVPKNIIPLTAITRQAAERHVHDGRRIWRLEHLRQLPVR